MIYVFLANGFEEMELWRLSTVCAVQASRL